MPCGCNSSTPAKQFVVTDDQGNCVMTDDQGNCVTYLKAITASSAARQAGVPGSWQVRPL